MSGYCSSRMTVWGSRFSSDAPNRTIVPSVQIFRHREKALPPTRSYCRKTVSACLVIRGCSSAPETSISFCSGVL